MHTAAGELGLSKRRRWAGSASVVSIDCGAGNAAERGDRG